MESVIGIFAQISAADAIVISMFLILNLLVGIYFSKGIKSLREYTIGGRNFSTATIAATIIATWIGGSSFAITSYESYKNGLYFIIPGIADGVSFFIIAYLYAPRMKEFLGNLSIAEAMGDMYGNKVRACTAISGIIPAVGNVSMQFSILTLLLTNFVGISGMYAVFFSSTIVIIYSSFGGIKAVTFTDVIQFFAFGIMIPITAFLIWLALDNSAMATLHVLETNPLFNYSDFIDINNPRFLSTLCLFLFFLIPGLDPALFQRISMGKNIKQVMTAFTIAGVMIIFCEYLVLNFIGVLLLADPGSTNIDANNIVDYIMSNYLAVGFKGAFVVSIMAMCMSTADSYINSASVLFSHDLLKSMGIYISEKWELLFVRITALFVGIAALMLSIFSQNLLDLMLSAYSFYMPVVSVPMILSIFGFRSSSSAVLLGMFAGFSTVCGFMIFAGVDNVVIPGMLANLIVYIASHYLLSQSGQWAGIKEKVALQEIQEERSNMVKGFFESIKRFNLYKYLKSSASKQEATYVYLGFFCVISTFASLYSLPKIITEQHALLVHIIAYGTLFLATILITYPAWMEKFKDQIFISFISHITIFTVLVVSTSLLVLISHFSQLQIVILTASLITVAILLRWYTTLLYMITGIVVSCMYLHYVSLDIAFGHITTEFTVLYVILMASSISVVFLKPKEDALEISEARSVDLWKKINEMDMALQKANNVKTEFLNNLSQEVRAPMTGITSLGQALWENYDFLPEAERKKCVKTMAQTSDRLIGLINNILDLSSLSSLKLELNLKKVNLSSLIHESIQKCMKLYLDKKALQFDIQIEKDVYLKCDEHYIGNTIDNLIINAIAYSKPNTIIRIILNTNDGNISFSIRDEGMGIPTDELVDIFHPFTVSSQASALAGSRGVGLSLCYSAIIAHKGKIWAESDGKSWAEFKFTI